MDLKKYQTDTLDTLGNFLTDAKVKGVEASFDEHAWDKVPYKLHQAIHDIPYVCLRIPTGGGKTILGARIVGEARPYAGDYPLVLWMVPSNQIRTQTLEALRNPRHPYRRELEDRFPGRVAVMDLAKYRQIKPDDIKGQVMVLVGTLASAKVTDTDLRNIYADDEELEQHFIGLSDTSNLTRLADGSRVSYSFDNVLRLHRPIVITDEAHNAKSELSYDTYERFHPSVIIELTATPSSKSNVLVNVPASALKDAHMIKLPVIVREHKGGWQQCLSHALQRRKYLEDLALQEPPEKGFVRPILLVRAENKGGQATEDVVHKHLTTVEGMDPSWIKIATGDQRQLDDVDLMDRDCPVRVVITKDALKEGWDCSFAYVLCSLANIKSDTAITQLLGRVLRMPYASERVHPDLNKAYAHVVSNHMGEGASELTEDLESMGFSEYEAKDSVETDPAQFTLSGGMDHIHGQYTMRLPKAPDLRNIPDEDKNHVDVRTLAGGGVEVTITRSVDEQTIEAVAKAVPKKEQEKVRKAVRAFNHQYRKRTSPAQTGVEFKVPEFMYERQGELVLFSPVIVMQAGWDPSQYPADMSAFRYMEDGKAYLVDLNEQGGVSHKADLTHDQSYRSTTVEEWDVPHLVSWLDRELAEADQTITRAQRVPWIALAVNTLVNRGFKIAQLWHNKYLVRERLLGELTKAREAARNQAVQGVLFGQEDHVHVDFNHAYEFGQDYPARFECKTTYVWQKHFYAAVGDINYRTEKGTISEEYLCALAIDMLEEVEVWVRNLAREGQFHLPKSTGGGKTYPDFVARLKDGRILVVEYKGGDRKSNEDSKDKELWGKLWARASGGKCIYLMAQKVDEDGLDVTGQLKKAIGSEGAI